MLGQDSVEQRRFIRHPVSLPLKYKVTGEEYLDKNKSRNSLTKNISRGGLLFTAKRPVKAESLIAIRMPFQEKIFDVRAKVVHCTRDFKGKLYNIGVCFQNPDEAFKVRLIEQMYLICEYRDLRSVQLGKNISLQDASLEWIKKYSEKFQKLYW